MNPNGNKPLYATETERRSATVQNTLRSRAKHREKFNAYKAAWTKANPDKVHEYNQKQYYKNHAQTLEYHKDYRDTLKAEVIKEYGGRCACCGENESGFLSIEHVLGYTKRPDVYDHPRRGGTAFYLWLRKNNYPKEGYELLCFNCNLGRNVNRATHGQCPHDSFDCMSLVSAC